MLNRLLYQVGLLMAVATIGFTGFLIMERIRQIEAVRTGFWDNLAYTTSQADFEIARLINALAVPDDVQSTGARDEIFVRYEVALGRLVGLTEGDTGRRILANEAVRKTVLSIKEAMADLEQDIGNYPGLSPQEKKAVLSSLGSLSDEFHRATVTIASLGDQDQTDFYRSLADAARLEILMLLLILIAGALAFANALLERRRFLQLNLSLSDAVSDRTAALQATNKRLQAEVAERGQAEERYRSLVDHATEAIVVIDADHGTFIEVNPRAESLYGLPRNELIGTYGLQILSPEFQPDGRRSDQLAKEHMQAALEGGFPTFEWLCRSIDNVDVPCEVSLARFPDPARRLVRGSIVDLTERRNAEASQAALERQLAQAQKLETIGQMTGGVAHDFNNLLSVIVGNLELLEETSIKDDQRELIQYAKNASLRGAALTRSMLNFARRANLSPETVSLSDLVRGMESWTSRTIPANISVTTDVKPGLWSVVADVSGAESALLNLVINARDAMPNGGRLVIETENVTVDEITASATGNELQPGRYAMVAVSDTGQGILPEEIAKVFEPFFSTKDPSRNSGLGLSMVYGFMSQSEGDVRIYSEPGVGTTVKLFFPAREEVQSDRDCSDGSNVAELGKPARILVVEDQADVLTVLTRSLETLGHLIIRARDGDEAIGQLSKSGAVDLLITDVVMPGKLQGPELAKELRRSFPDLPVIFLSGYASDAAWHADGLERKDIQLMKPVARKELVAAVTRALGAGS